MGGFASLSMASPPDTILGCHGASCLCSHLLLCRLIFEIPYILQLSEVFSPGCKFYGSVAKAF